MNSISSEERRPIIVNSIQHSQNTLKDQFKIMMPLAARIARSSTAGNDTIRRRIFPTPTRLGLSVSSSSGAAADNNETTKMHSTEKWLDKIVIGEKLCPFAFTPLSEGKIRIVASNATNADQAVLDVRRQVQELMLQAPPPQHETTLVVFDYKDSFVQDFLEFVRLSWTLQEEAVGDQFSQELQLVLFHPLATHQTYGAMPADEHDDTAAADYTIRSPYPTIHLLREVDVMKAVTSGYPNLEYLPSRNKARLIQLGIRVCQQRLEDCYTKDSGDGEDESKQ